MSSMKYELAAPPSPHESFVLQVGSETCLATGIVYKASQVNPLGTVGEGVGAFLASPSIRSPLHPPTCMSCVAGVTAHVLLLQEGLPAGVLLGFHTQANYSSQLVSCLACGSFLP